MLNDTKLALIAIAVSAMATTAFATRTHIIPHVFDTKGNIAGFAYTPQGGEPTVEVIEDGSGGFLLGKPTYGNLTFKLCPTPDSSMWDSLRDLNRFFASPMNGRLSSTEPNSNGEYRSITFFDCFPSKLDLPLPVSTPKPLGDHSASP